MNTHHGLFALQWLVKVNESGVKICSLIDNRNRR